MQIIIEQSSTDECPLSSFQNLTTCIEKNNISFSKCQIDYIFLEHNQNELEHLKKTKYVLEKPIIETPSRWSLIHSVLTYLEEGNRKTKTGVVEEVKDEINKHKEFYTTLLPKECFDSKLDDFEVFGRKNPSIILVALENIFQAKHYGAHKK